MNSYSNSKENLSYLVFTKLNLVHRLLAGCWGRNGNYKMDYHNRNHSEEYELPLFDLSTIAKSTNNFSVVSKIGEGGYGPVYKVITYSFAVVYMK